MRTLSIPPCALDHSKVADPNLTLARLSDLACGCFGSLSRSLRCAEARVLALEELTQRQVRSSLHANRRVMKRRMKRQEQAVEHCSLKRQLARLVPMQ